MLKATLRIDDLENSIMLSKIRGDAPVAWAHGIEL